MTIRDDDKAKRLAAALRENLRRRKAQARETAILPGAGRGTARGAVDSVETQAQSPDEDTDEAVASLRHSRFGKD